MVRRASIAAVLGALVLPAAASAIPLGATALVDRPTGLGALPFDGAGRAEADLHAISANGCFVVFAGTGDALLPSDDNAAFNVYRLDRCTAGNPIVQVNTTSTGTPAEAGSSSFAPSISSDGRKVAFLSDSHVLDAAATTLGRSQIFVKDLQTGALEVASRGTGAGGAPITATSGSTPRGLVTGDGHAVVFVAPGPMDADNVDGVTGENDVYVRDLLAHTTHMVSVTTGGGAGHGADPFAFDTDVSAARVIFTTNQKLDPVHDTDPGTDAYIRLGVGGSGESTQLLSTGSAFGVGLSPDGVFAAFTDFTHAFVATCIFSCGSAAQEDAPRSGGSNTGGVRRVLFGPNTHGDPTSRVYFITTSGLDSGDHDAVSDLYGRDLADSSPNTAIHLMTGGVAGDVGDDVSVTDDGGLALVNTDQSPQLLAVSGGLASVLSHPPGQAPRNDDAGSGFSRGARAISDDGRFVAFESEAPAFGAPPGGGEILVRDVVTGTTKLASVGSDGVSPGNAYAFFGAMDAAGDRLVFSSAATNLVPGVTDGKSHVYLRDLAAGTTRVIDRTAAGTASADGAFGPSISGDGKRVVFASSSVDLPPAPFDVHSHIYEVDLGGGTMVLVDRTANGVVGNASAQTPAVDGAGDRVVFYSTASNLDGGAHPAGAIFLRDIAANTTKWVSVPQDGNPAHEFPFDATAISRDGRRVAFTESSADFGFGAIADSEVFVHDLVAGTTTLASTGPLGAADPGVHDMALSGDGRTVAFTSFASNLPGNHGVLDVYVRDLAAGSTALAALRDGGGGPGRLGSIAPSLSGDGACLAFGSRSDDLVAGGYGPDFNHVFLRALKADCPVLPPVAAGSPPPGSGGGAPTGPASTPVDEPPVVSGLRVTNAAFALAAGRTALNARKHAKRGTAFVFRLSEDARTAITIARVLPGRRSGKRCVKPRKGLKRRCTRLATVGVLRRAKTKAGANRVAFTGRLGRRALSVGRYRATVVATDPGGHTSAPRTVAFRVVRR